MTNELYYKEKISPITFKEMTFDEFILWVKKYIYKSTGNLKIGKFRYHLREIGMKKKSIEKI